MVDQFHEGGGQSVVLGTQVIGKLSRRLREILDPAELFQPEQPP